MKRESSNRAGSCGLGVFFGRWILVAPLCGCATVSPYRLVQDEDARTCRALGEVIARVPKPTPANVCGWLDSLGKGTNLAPKWEPYVPTEHMIRDMRLARHAYFNGADEKTIEKLWHSTYRSAWEQDRANNTFAYQRAILDLDNDGERQVVVKETRSGCTGQWLAPASPKLFVIDKEKVDVRYSATTTTVLSPLVTEGGTILAFVEFVHEANAASSAAKPLLVVQFAWPLAPTAHHPFTQGQPVCTFSILPTR